MPALRADDKVLLLAIPAVAELAAMARVLMHGCVVALGTADQVHEARRALAEFDNVMLIEAGPSAIPWRGEYFTQIVVPPEYEPLWAELSGEIHRVLAPGGAIVRSTIEA